MKKQNFLSLLLFITGLLIGGCGSDPAPKQKFVGIDESVSLSNARLYLKGDYNYSNDNGDFVYRLYFLTDGEYSSGTGWNIYDYIGATYVLAFQPIVPVADDFTAGTYNLEWGFETLTDNSIYFYGETTPAGEYYEVTDVASAGIFTIGGNMEVGGTMTIKFKGSLSHWVDVGEVWEETLFNSSIFVKAEVIEVPL